MVYTSKRTTVTVLLWCYISVSNFSLYFLDADIAFNKPAKQSSTYLGDSSRYGAQFAVNGMSQCHTEDGPVAQTDWEKGWWKVNLQAKYYIRTVEIWPRTSILK